MLLQRRSMGSHPVMQFVIIRKSSIIPEVLRGRPEIACGKWSEVEVDAGREMTTRRQGFGRVPMSATFPRMDTQYHFQQHPSFLEMQ